MPAPSRRRLIAEALLARIEEIKVASGYNTDAGLHVTYGKTASSDDDPKPSLALVSGASVVQDVNLELESTRRWVLAVSGLMDEDPTDPAKIEDLVADIKRALFRPEDVVLGLGAFVVELEDAGAEGVNDVEEGGKAVGCSVPLVVRYREGYGQP